MAASLLISLSLQFIPNPTRSPNTMLDLIKNKKKDYFLFLFLHLIAEYNSDLRILSKKKSVYLDLQNKVVFIIFHISLLIQFIIFISLILKSYHVPGFSNRVSLRIKVYI